MTNEELKQLIENPLMLFAAMYLATLVSALKQMGSAKLDGIKPPTCIEYFTKYWYETIAVVLGNALAFLMLVETNTLNLASAIGLGYMTNSLADVLRSKNGRSAAVAGVSKEGE